MDLNTKKLFSREFEQRLQILTDLSPKDVQALYEISEGLPLTVHPSTRNSLKRDNLIVSEGKGFKLTRWAKPSTSGHWTCSTMIGTRAVIWTPTRSIG